MTNYIMCSTSRSPSRTTSTNDNITSIDLEVWFVCHPCKLWFKNVPEIIEHKKQVHFEELQGTKFIVFEEAKLERTTNIASGPFSPDQTDAPQATAPNYAREVVKVEKRAPDHNFHPDQEGTLNVDLTECEFQTDDTHSDTHETITLDNVKLIVSDDKSAPHFIKIDLNDIASLRSETDANLPPNSDSDDDATEATQNEVHFNNELNSPSLYGSEIEALPNPYVLLGRLTLTQIRNVNSSNHSSATMGKSAAERKLTNSNRKKLVRSFKCGICDNSFRNRYKLQRHMLTHSDLRPFKCHLCDNSFKYKHVLTEHVQRHSDARPFKCLKPFCGKYFKCEAYYKQHLAIHEGKKSFECAQPNCEMAFRRKSDLKRHMDSHWNLQKFKCNYPNCSRKFNRLQYLKVHFKKRHAEREPGSH